MFLMSGRLGRTSPTFTLTVSGRSFTHAQDRAPQILELAFSAEAE
jgi:hypothetical protein